MTGFEELPRQHQHALLAARYLGGTISRIGDLFVAGVEQAELRDLVDLGYMRKNWLSWELTLMGWQMIGNRRLTS
jgi:hypothetical protein